MPGATASCKPLKRVREKTPPASLVAMPKKEVDAKKLRQAAAKDKAEGKEAQKKRREPVVCTTPAPPKSILKNKPEGKSKDLKKRSLDQDIPATPERENSQDPKPEAGSPDMSLIKAQKVLEELKAKMEDQDESSSAEETWFFTIGLGVVSLNFPYRGWFISLIDSGVII